MTREYEPTPTTKAAQETAAENVENPSRILGLWKIQCPQFVPENTQAAG
jgi:hypothetical protein